MNIFDFMSAHVVLTWFLAWGVLTAVYFALHYGSNAVVLIVRRILRTLNVLARGWPPAHLDADGDFRPLPKPEDRKP